MRLHPRCHVIDGDGGVLLCNGRERLKLLEQADGDLARRLLGWLRTPTAAFPTDAVAASRLLRMMTELEGAGFAVAEDFAESWSVPGPVPLRNCPRLPGNAVAVAGRGEVADHVASTLSEFGAHVTALDEVRTDAELSGVELLVACPPGPDLSFLDATNSRALAAGVAHLPVMHLGDEGVVGPYGVAGRSACFRCWELRWLGLTLSTTAEVRLHAHLRDGGWRLETGRPLAALRYLAERAAHLAATSLVADKPSSEVWIADFTAGSATAHPLEPHPGCGRCTAPYVEPGPRDRPFTVAGSHAPLSAPADLAPLVDSRVGAATLVETEPVDATDSGMTALATAHARFASPHPEEVGQDSEGWTHGAAPTEDGAGLVALAEALERYCGIFTPLPAVTASYDSLGDQALWPPALPLYTARQYARPGFPFRPFDPAEALPWTWGYSLVEQQPRLIPQAAVRYGPGESLLLHESSSGVAAHSSQEAALLGAALEAVERDALMIFWLNRLSPPLADLAGSTDPFVAAAQREVRRWGYDLRVADLTTDLGIPVLLAIATREDLAAPALVVGAGAALDPRHAIRKALRELLGGIRGWKDVEWTVPELLELDDVRRLADHARAYYHPGWLSRADFLWSSPDRTRVPAGIGADRSATEQLASLVAHLKDAGLDLLAVELTTPDVARHGIHVLRAVVPGLQPIGFGPAGLRLGGRRLYEAPRTMAYTSSNTTEESLNPDPHCYP